MSRRRRQGFTLIEVMVALGIMTMGAMAIIALLAQIIRGNAHARQLNTAMNVGQKWVERLKQDAHSWNQVASANGTPTPDTVLANTRYLFPVSSAFRELDATSNVVSTAFDYQGNDVAPAGGNAFFYCAAYRNTWIYFGSAMRVDVRVFWARDGSGANIMADFPECIGNQTQLDPPNGLLRDRYHVVYLPTAIGVTQVTR